MSSSHNNISESTSARLVKLPANPLVSVIIANYNYGRYLDDAIRSILEQTYGTFEMIIIDDGSTDNSEEIYQKYSTDQRIRVIRQKRRGQGNAMTKAFEVSRGEIICFLDADDMYLPTKFEMVVNAFQTHPQAGVCTHFLQIVSKAGKQKCARVSPYLMSGWLANQALVSGGNAGYVNTSGLAIRREIGEYVFPIPDYVFRSVDAYIVGISCFLTRFVAISKILAYYRMHGENISGGQVLSYESVADWLNSRHAIFQGQQNLLKKRFSAAIADHLALDDNTPYLYMQLWMHIFAGKKPGRLDDRRLNEVVSRLPKTPKNLLRRVLLRLPAVVSRMANPLWTQLQHRFTWPAPMKVKNIS